MANTYSPEAILRTLVSTPSTSSMSNLPVLAVAERVLLHAGWRVERQPYSSPDGMAKANLIARPAEQHGDTLELALVCHTDTVPFDLAAWPEATTLVEREGYLHGCGACDVKGSLAAILAAIVRTPQVERNVALILTADEEIGCIGAARLLAETSLRTRRALICEPTSLAPAVAGKGYGLARVHVAGQEAHSALAIGASAIDAAAAMIARVREGIDIESHNPLFRPGWTTVNVGTIHGGSAKNIVAGQCEFLVEWRPLPQQDPSAFVAWLTELAAETEHSHRGCTVTVERLRAEPGFSNPPDSAFAAALAQGLGTKPCGISFGSEATRFARIADEVVVLGPGDMRTAHSSRECVPIAELDRFAEAVSALLRGEIG